SSATGEDWYIDDIIWTGQPTNVANKKPENLDLAIRNYPNPFNPITTISYNLPQAAMVNLAVFDLNGRQVAQLIDHRQAAGSYEIRFDASQLPSGTYFCRLIAGERVDTHKMLLLK
ncbi:MAG: T9SS type A sorting domain-containing protein, partial [candidate division KSB1 bacterium]|nr:T9SS type A sorting domain-containing protein [candidate division KSB1 bacterium]